MNNEDEFREYTDDEVREILKNALKTKISPEKKINKKELEKALINHLSQFLSCYKILGYDMTGKAVMINQFDNKLEKDALEHLFMETMAHLIEQRT